MEEMRKYISCCKNIPLEVSQFFNELNDLRNDFMHSGFRKDARNANFLISKLENRTLLIEYINSNLD